MSPPAGFIAGPGFVHNFKQNFKSYVCLGLVITLFGGVACVLCILIGRSFTGLSHAEFTAILVGLLAGALTSTPRFLRSQGHGGHCGAGVPGAPWATASPTSSGWWGWSLLSN
ncbi:MAG: hypothetical protein ACLT9P_05755 [Evtepia gabavorous]